MVLVKMHIGQKKGQRKEKNQRGDLIFWQVHPGDLRKTINMNALLSHVILLLIIKKAHWHFFMDILRPSKVE